ncbi:chromosome segregation in meiosis protein 3 [Rhizoctonia solani]|uniref:Chromosome segregation in meiosis protein n=1 Tax=Rhizoctonia solani TaxID=456999 RepID=A0A8H8T2H2_9AGAM|nr:chromosome segregation in meiosis protein 3 [Rhizoctonia solani]QRW27491.1 chromosome segregation in meiosis protein 3 [Rhizoctonia solani]
MDNIWDDDAVQVSRNGSSRARIVTESDEEDRPLKRARTAGASKPLFNPESDDEDNLPADVGALFDGLDDTMIYNNFRLNSISENCSANPTNALRGPVDVDGKAAKARKTLPKLDENRLLDQGDGMPALVRRSKEFKVKGKGHELSDLNRLMQMYQLWAHKMFPKMQFQDTVERVEKLCRTKRMHVALSTWRDIDKAPAPGEEDPDALMEEQDPEQDQEARHPPTSSPARITMEPGGPPMRQSQFDKEPDDDEEMWRDMMEAMETQNQEKEKEKEQGGYKQKIATSGKQPEDYGGGFDDEDWAIMDQMEEEAGKSTQPNGLGGSKIQSTLPPSSPPWTDHDVSSDAPPEPAGPSEDEDDFYAMYEP